MNLLQEYLDLLQSEGVIGSAVKTVKRIAKSGKTLERTNRRLQKAANKRKGYARANKYAKKSDIRDKSIVDISKGYSKDKLAKNKKVIQALAKKKKQAIKDVRTRNIAGGIAATGAVAGGAVAANKMRKNK